jgi:glycosyltransferase involved in cell wall biosynthesis
MSRINVLWAIDHVCYDGDLHGGGRLYWNVLPQFSDRYNIIPCMLRASEEVRRVFKHSPVKPRILDKGKFDLTTLWTFLQLIKREDIHVMHLHCYAASSFGRLASLLTGVPCIIHDYDTAVYFPYPMYLSIADRMLSSVTSRAVAASPMVRDYFIERRKIEPAKVSLALHAIPAEKFDPIAPNRIVELKESWKVDPHTRIVGTVTKLGPQRGNRLFLRAASRVLERSPDTVFVVAYKETVYHRQPDQSVSANSERESSIKDLQDQAAELGIADNVRLVEMSDCADELVAALDLFVAPWLSDRFSSVQLLEAMASGTPVVATDIGEQQEIISDGTDGYLVPTGDEAKLSETIIAALAQPEWLRRVGEQARMTAEKYSIDSYARRLEGWYRSLAKRETTGASPAHKQSRTDTT